MLWVLIAQTRDAILRAREQDDIPKVREHGLCGHVRKVTLGGLRRVAQQQL